MPVITAPQTQNNHPPSPLPAAKAWLSSHNATISIVGLVLLGLVHFATRRRRKSKRNPGQRPSWLVAGTENQPWILEKSRGVSKNGAFDMASSQPAELSKLLKESSPGSLKNEDGVAKTWTESGRHSSTEDLPGAIMEDQTPRGHLKARPPPPLPIIPPNLSSEVYQFEERRLSMSVSTMGDVETSFIHQPNPDYHSPDSSSTTAVSQGQDMQKTTRRRSYTKTVSLGTGSSPHDTDSEPTFVSSPVFAPSSFPSSSPILPLAPHESFEEREVDVQGEIISVTDDQGAGWKRHTRVYGGGVCLACLASGGEHGGFYGARVRPEEKR